MAFIDKTHSLAALIHAHYDLEPITQASPLTGGEWKTLWRLDGASASYVVSLSHPTTTVESIAYEHGLLHYLHAHLPQVPAPLLTRDGHSYFIDQERIISLLPFIPGEMADGDQVHLLAARFLAHFHRVSVNYPDQSPRPDVPAWREWGWHGTAWPAIQTMLATSPATQDPIGQRFWQSCGEWAAAIADRRVQIAGERSHFQQWIADLAKSDRPLTTGLLHDDFHGGNLLVADGAVTALLDWDSCHPDWLLFDLSNAIWEFCHDDATHMLVLKDAHAFLQTYAAAGGPVTAAEFALIIPFIRCRRMIEILTALRGIATGEAWDESPDYLVHNLLSLENLQGIRLYPTRYSTNKTNKTMHKIKEPLMTIARTEELTPSMREAIVQLCYAAFQEADFLNLFAYFPSGGRHFLAYDGTLLVSHAIVTTRWVQPAGLPMLKTAYVDAVATLPAYQGQGFGSAVMQHLAEHIPDYEIACLQTERQSFYARLGWEEWRGPLAGRGAEGLVPTPDQRGVMILRLAHTPPFTLDGLLTIEVSGRIW